MIKEPKTESLTLSRFFHENINTIKNKNVIEDFEKSTYFCKIPIETNNVARRKKAKEKIFGPKFKGFTNSDKKQSELSKNQTDLLVRNMENSIKPPNDFFGFSKEEIETSNKLCDKNIREVEYFENNTFQNFLGFSKQEQNVSISDLSDILEKCVLIRSEIYKNIDRRILTYHLKEEKFREKVVCSKYWSKQENLVVKLESVNQLKKDEVKSEKNGINSFKIRRKKNCVKMESIKTEIELKPDSDYISENFKFQQGLKAHQNTPLSPTKDIKVQEAPFIQIKKELIVPTFVPPRSPHNLIEEDLYHDPWALLIATIFLNKTAGRTARPYVFWFLEENPDPLMVLGKKVEQLETYFGALGLQRTRATQVWRMSHDFVYKKWKKVSELYGIGSYGEDAFRMFCLGDFSIEPRDRYLRIYKAWYKMQEKGARLKEMNSLMMWH